MVRRIRTKCEGSRDHAPRCARATGKQRLVLQLQLQLQLRAANRAQAAPARRDHFLAPAPPPYAAPSSFPTIRWLEGPHLWEAHPPHARSRRRLRTPLVQQQQQHPPRRHSRGRRRRRLCARRSRHRRRRRRRTQQRSTAARSGKVRRRGDSRLLERTAGGTRAASTALLAFAAACRSMPLLAPACSPARGAGEYYPRPTPRSLSRAAAPPTLQHSPRHSDKTSPASRRPSHP